MNILFVSTLCSPKTFDYILSTATRKPPQSIQKFNRLLVEGFLKKDPSNCVETLSSFPVVRTSHARKFWFIPSERSGNVKYCYANTINFPILKNLLVFIGAIVKTFWWVLKSFNKDKVIVCDALNLTIATAAMLVGKITRTRTVVIITDMPHLTVGSKSDTSIIKKPRLWFSYKMISSYNGYVVLTEAINDVANKAGKPHIVMEGLVDSAMVLSENTIDAKEQEKIIMYAGGIYAVYGVKKLVDAFMEVKGENLRFYVYGDGPMADDMAGYCEADSRIRYFGVVENAEVVEMQLKATLLLNPRPTSEELTKYSFPSKNMESMVSGTPLVTTNLPGMPQEYHPFVYLFEDETVEGMRDTLQALLVKPREELHEFGLKAKQFVLEKKNNKIQAGRILEFIENKL